MALHKQRLAAQARRTYELGRLRAQLAWMALAIPVLLLSLGVSHRPGITLATGGLLALLILTLRWRGQDLARAVVPGYLAGVAAFAFPLLACETGFCPTRPSLLLLLFCATGGLAAGSIMTLRAVRCGCCNFPYLSAAGAVAALTASLTCSVAGVGGILGMSLGLALASTPALALARNGPP